MAHMGSFVRKGEDSMKTARWKKRETNLETVYAIKEALGVSFAVANVLQARGIRTPEEGKRFMTPELRHLHAPMLLKDMTVAVERILRGMAQGERMTIFGDFDVDGMTSVSTLMDYFNVVYPNMVDFYIPARSEGYGLNKAALEQIHAAGTTLVISVDCGITAVEEATFARDIGLDLIITDHHAAPEILPEAVAVINPRRQDETYPFAHLAGVGVAYKLAVALQQEIRHPSFDAELTTLLDLVALGTVADLMPLQDENRILVSKGLERINDKTSRAGMQTLLKEIGLDDKKITSGHLGFQVGPRINAIGRLTTLCHTVVELFTSQEADEARRIEIASNLSAMNEQRKNIQEGMLKEADQLYHETKPNHSHFILLSKEGWNSGIKGIVASNLIERYYKPIILATPVPNTDLIEGSARSIEGFNIKEALDEIKHLFLRYGGHDSAAGMTFHKDNLEEIHRRLNEIAARELQEEDYLPVIRYDAEISERDILFSAVRELEQLEPFGAGNASPQFLYTELYPSNIQSVGKEKEHLRMQVSKLQKKFGTIGFQLGTWKTILEEGYGMVDVLCTMGINEYMGKQSLQLILKDVRYCE